MADKKGPATHVQWAHGFLKFGNFRKTSGRHADVSPVRDTWHWTMLCVDDDQGSDEGGNYPCTHQVQLNVTAQDGRNLS